MTARSASDLTYLTDEDQRVLRALIEDERVLQVALDLEYEESPVDPEIFFTDPYYLGQTGVDLYPKLLDDLIECCRGDYTEVIMGGAIGYGKSTFAEFGILRVLYETLCLRDPQASFGLMKGSSIYLINLSVTESQARKAIFTGIVNKVRQSPFFRETFPYDKTVTSELRFPKNITIMPGASTDNSILGLNLIAGVLDEGNFMRVQHVSRASTVQARIASGGVYDKAQSLYTAMVRRLKSRFLKYGRLPGKIFTISSAQYPGDFLERRMRAALSDPSVFARSYSLWDVKREQYSPLVFRVEIGTEMRGSRILTDDVDPETITGKVIEVPIDFRLDFEKDIDGAIRDIAGISTLTVNPFIKNFSAVINCIDASRKHPYTAESTTLEDGHGLHKRHYLVPGPDGKPTLKFNPSAIRVAHIDQSLRRDATGLAVGHIANMVKVLRRNQQTGEEYEEWAPLIFYDLLLRIVPPKGREIQLDRIREIIYSLSANGMKIELVTMDSWQSAEALQQFKKRGYLVDQLSVDRSVVPYETLKSAFYESRVNMYQYEPALQELRRLEFDRLKGKVDHAEGGSKDVADAMAGVAFTLTSFASRLFRPEVDVRVY